MKRTFWLVAFVLLFGAFTVASASVIKRLDLGVGRTDYNTIHSPVFDTEGIGAVSFGEIRSTYDTDAAMIYVMTKKQLKAKPKIPKPLYRLDPSIDLGSVLGEALRSEATAMGFGTGTDGWTVTGTLHDLVLEIRVSGGGFGPLLFFGYMDLELEIKAAYGGTETSRMRLYDMLQIYNAGYGARDEAKEALTGFLVESAQEAVARLNGEVFHAPPVPAIGATVDELEPNGDDQEHALLLLGLSGSTAAVPSLLDLLEAQKDESDRQHIINALANIRSGAAFDPLSRRYAGEDEDCRLYIVKAMDYLGTERAREFIADHGLEDEDLPVRVWASRAASSP